MRVMGNARPTRACALALVVAGIGLSSAGLAVAGGVEAYHHDACGEGTEFLDSLGPPKAPNRIRKIVSRCPSAEFVAQHVAGSADHAAGECAKAGVKIDKYNYPQAYATQPCFARGVHDFDCRQEHNPNAKDTPETCVERRLAGGPKWLEPGAEPWRKPDPAPTPPPPTPTTSESAPENDTPAAETDAGDAADDSVDDTASEDGGSTDGDAADGSGPADEQAGEEEEEVADDAASDDASGGEESGGEDSGGEVVGDEESGSEESGDESTGSEESGDEDTGSEESGDEGTGGEESGGEESGEEDVGDEEAGDGERSSGRL